MNAISVVFSPMHKLASAQFKVKITSYGVMQQRGSLLLAPEGSLLAKSNEEELTPRCHVRGKILPNLGLNRSPAKVA